MDKTEIEALKRHPNVLRVYSSRVKLRKDGREYVGCCPFHSEKTPSFKVSLSDQKWLYKCFGCNEGGDILKFVQTLEACNFPQAVEKVREAVGDNWSQQRAAVDATFKPFAAEEPKEYTTIALSQYAKFETAFAESKEAQAYLSARGIDFETAKRLHTGFRQSIGNLAGKDNQDIAAGGWLLLPRVQGESVVAVHYRSIVKKCFSRQPHMRTALYNTDSIDFMEPVFCVEGEMDAMSLEAAGFRAVSLPSASTKLTPEDKDLLMSASCVVLAGDTDQAGSDAMEKLWKELQERTYLLKWPVGCKDANDALMKNCGGDIEKFKAMVEELTATAQMTVVPHVVTLQGAMSGSSRTNMQDHPQRLRFPWPSVDSMANLLPSGVLFLFATSTGMGKTTFVMNAALAEAQRGQVVLNYSAELSYEEYGNLVAAHVLRKHRNELTDADYKEAVRRVGDVKFYIGRNPDLSTVGEVLDLMEAAIKRLSPDLVIIDHIHYLTRNAADTVKEQENAFQRIKNLAIKYKLKMICVGQPRKANQQNRGKLVSIADVKGSEVLTSDSDMTLAIHRDTVKNFDPDNPPKEPYVQQTDVHLLKGRSQGSGSAFARLVCLGELATFVEPSRDTPPPEMREI